MRIMTFLIALALLCVPWPQMAEQVHAQTPPNNTGTITLESTERIRAGDAWDVAISIPTTQTGAQVDAFLVNGMRTFDVTLTLDTGGVAVWQFPADEITQAGASQLIVRYGDQEARRSLQVMPLAATDVDLFTTANALPAYGDGAATIMVLPRDEWGNAPPNIDTLLLDVLYPDETHRQNTFNYVQGLGWLDLRSVGNPGRVRLGLTEGGLLADLELTQTPGTAASVIARVEPSCITADGRDLMTVTAHVRDKAGNAVAAGTLVTFTWLDGQAAAQTIDGLATLRLPTPTKPGWMIFRAHVGELRSEVAILQVAVGRCSDE